ncbi:MAG: type IV toxin-antitoxin system AbiEi family antitoxin [Candidatus Margulisbacteria bacterium]|nr:type IV toxin-antitoxin system AbiEi family antitoxin [Candidatus Margulisiibacteriota bacterium]
MLIINLILKNWPKGTVALQPWFESQGAYQQLLSRYEKSEWIERIGKGAYTRSGDKVDWTGALHPIQYQDDKPIHVGAKTALELRGKSHYVALGIDSRTTVYLFSPPNIRLPKWFSSRNWGVKVELYATELFPESFYLGISDINIDTFSIKVASPERAMMEYLHLIPHKESLDEASKVFENLYTLRSEIVQKLLENCSSIKVKRLFMFLSDYFRFPWAERIDTSKIDFGKGKRKITDGFFDPKYQITIPLQFKPNTEEAEA